MTFLNLRYRQLQHPAINFTIEYRNQRPQVADEHTFDKRQGEHRVR